MTTSKRTMADLLADASRALGMTQLAFGAALGVSRRTSSRWHVGRTVPNRDQLRKLVALLVPRDATLAAEAAACIGETPASLGLVKAPSTAAPAIGQAPRDDRLELVLCAAADEAGAAPRTLVPLLLTAFRRAREVGLTLEAAEKALAARQAGTTP